MSFHTTKRIIHFVIVLYSDKKVMIYSVLENMS